MNDAAIQIEFIPDGSSDVPLVLVYGYDTTASRDLFHAIRSIRDLRMESVAIHELPGFRGVGVELRFHACAEDRGVLRTGAELRFDCYLTPQRWTLVEDLLAPFCDRFAQPGPFQWLDETSDIALLFSTGRGW